jgi:hypothetical protein
MHFNVIRSNEELAAKFGQKLSKTIFLVLAKTPTNNIQWTFQFSERKAF